MPKNELRSTINTPKIDDAICTAASRHEATKDHAVSTHFERGQWWASCIECGRTWSIVDAEGGPAVDGFDFEQVAEGDGFCDENARI